jgi:hypothetical protein
MNCEEYDVCGGVVCEFPIIEPEEVNNDEEINMDVIDSITITPIAKNFKPTPKSQEFDPNDVTPSSPDSKRDYGEQLERMNDGLKPMWDDSKFNKSKEITTLFAFVFNNECVRFHLILQVLSPENRLPSWSRNVGHGDRNVLELSNMIYEMDWNTWLKLGGHKKVQGTTRLANKVTLKQMIENINNIIHI